MRRHRNAHTLRVLESHLRVGINLPFTLELENYKYISNAKYMQVSALCMVEFINGMTNRPINRRMDIWCNLYVHNKLSGGEC